MDRKLVLTVILLFFGAVMETSANPPIDPSKYQDRIRRLKGNDDYSIVTTTETVGTSTTDEAITHTNEPEKEDVTETTTELFPSLSTSTPSPSSGDASVMESPESPFKAVNVDYPIVISNSCDKDLREIVLRGMACTCDVNSRYVEIRDDYKYTAGIGAHKLHTAGASFNDARKICSEEGAHLAVINSLREEKILIDMFKAVDSESFEYVVSTGEARLGIHDLYKEGDWVTVLGDPLAKTGYSKWGVTVEGIKQPDNAGGEHCAVLMIHEDSNGMNDVECQMSYPFFCEIPEDRIV